MRPLFSTGKTSIWWRIATSFVIIGTIMGLPVKSRSASTDSLKTSYHQGLNTETWRGSLNIQKTLFNHYVSVSEFLSSSRLNLKPGEDKWKDQHHFTLSLKRSITPDFTVGLSGKSYVFSDKQTGYYNDIRNHRIGLSSSFQKKNLQIPLQIGISEDHRHEQKDKGYYYQFGMDAPHFSIDNYNNTFNLLYEMEDLIKRKNSTFSVGYGVHRQFQPGTSDTLRLTSHQQRRDYYVSASGEIESREEKIHTAANSLQYRLSQRLQCHIHGSLSSRQLKISRMEDSEKIQNHEREDFNARGALNLSFQTQSFSSTITFSYLTFDQKYKDNEQTSSPSVYSGLNLSRAPDNKSVYTTLSLQSGWRFFSRDSLHLSMYLQRFRYDTPDEENFDDRDELRLQFVLQEIHTFSSSLSMRVNANINLLHFVYIYGEKSADNNWTRIFRLNPEITWSPSSSWSWRQSAEVLANYISYDFESILPSTKSFLYRKFRLEESLEVSVTPTISLQLLYRLELDENGKFLWNKWLEQKLVDRTNHTVQLYFKYSPWSSLTVQPGFIYYSRKGYKYLPVDMFDTQKENYIDFQNYGPSLTVQYKSDRLNLHLSASKIATRTFSVQNQILNRIHLKLSWAI